MYILKLALRYVFVRAVNYIAIATVAIALIVHIVVMGVLDGMLVNMETRIMTLGQHASINCLYSETMPGNTELKKIEQEFVGKHGIKAIAPMLQEYGVLRMRNRVRPCLIMGIDLEKEIRYSNLGKYLDPHVPDDFNPQWRPKGQDGPLPPIYIGNKLSERMGDLKAGDIVRLGFTPPGKGRPDTQSFEVVSIHKTNSYMRDTYGVYIPMEEARKLFLPPGAVERGTTEIISIWLEDPHAADTVAEVIIPRMARSINLGKHDYWISTWQREWRSIYQGMAYENMLQEIIMVMMKIMAGFCVFAILATLVSRRVRDVGLLRCIGMSRRGVMGVFILVGFLIGIVGACIGVAIGVPLALYINEIAYTLTGEALYGPHAFGMDGGMPIEIYFWKTALYAGAAVLIAVIAAVAPATWAARRQPINALRDE